MDDCLTAPDIGMRRHSGRRFADDVRHGQTEFTADAVGKVLFHPSGKPQRKCREDDLVEGSTPKGVMYRLDGVGIPDFSVDLGPQITEESDGRFKVALRDFVSSSLGPHEVLMGGCSRDHEAECGGPRRQDVFHLLRKRIAGKRLVPDDQVAPQESTSRSTDPSYASPTSGSVRTWTDSTSVPRAPPGHRTTPSRRALWNPLRVSFPSKLANLTVNDRQAGRDSDRSSECDSKTPNRCTDEEVNKNGGSGDGRGGNNLNPDSTLTPNQLPI